MDYIEKNRERIEDIDEDTFYVVRVLMNIPNKFIKKKEKTEGDSGMCTAMKEWLADDHHARYRCLRNRCVREMVP